MDGRTNPISTTRMPVSTVAIRLSPTVSDNGESRTP
jgi:hypothetical protein